MRLAERGFSSGARRERRVSQRVERMLLDHVRSGDGTEVSLPLTWPGTVSTNHNKEHVSTTTSAH